MSIFRKLFGGSERPAPTHDQPQEPDAGTGYFNTEVVGESFYQPALKDARVRLAKREKDRWVISVRVRCEPTNKHDPNAVVIQTLQGKTLGHLPRDRAARFCGGIAALGGSVLCKGNIVGGYEDAPNLGIWLDLCHSNRLPKPAVKEGR